MAQLPPANVVADRWATGMGRTDKVRDGVQRVTESPMAKAATPEAEQKYLMGVQESVSSGRRRAGLMRRDLSFWKDKMLNVGIPRMSQGATAAKAVYTQAMSEVLAYEASGLDQIRQMPSSTPEEREQRMLAWSRYMRAFKRGM